MAGPSEVSATSHEVQPPTSVRTAQALTAGSSKDAHLPTAIASITTAESPPSVSRYWAWLIVVWIRDVANAEAISHRLAMPVFTVTSRWDEGADEASSRPKTA